MLTSKCKVFDVSRWRQLCGQILQKVIRRSCATPGTRMLGHEQAQRLENDAAVANPPPILPDVVSDRCCIPVGIAEV
jgi:hypothetical protein